MKEIKEKNSTYFVISLIIISLTSCISKQKIKNNVIENTITERLNDNNYKIYTKISAYSKIKKEDELLLNEAVKLESNKLCKSQNNIDKVSFHIQAMEEDKNYVTSITAILSCKKPKDEFLSINENENQQHINANGINFSSIKEMSNFVDSYINNYQSNNCKENSHLKYNKTLFQLLEDTPYTYDESNSEMLDFLGYEIEIDKNC